MGVLSNNRIRSSFMSIGPSVYRVIWCPANNQRGRAVLRTHKASVHMCVCTQG